MTHTDKKYFGFLYYSNSGNDSARLNSVKITVVILRLTYQWGCFNRVTTSLILVTFPISNQKWVKFKMIQLMAFSIGKFRAKLSYLYPALSNVIFAMKMPIKNTTSVYKRAGYIWYLHVINYYYVLMNFSNSHHLVSLVSSYSSNLYHLTNFALPILFPNL